MSSYGQLNGYENAKIQSLTRDKASVDAVALLIKKGETVDVKPLAVIEDKFKIRNLAQIVYLVQAYRSLSTGPYTSNKTEK
jgi:hypothetical protein